MLLDIRRDLAFDLVQIHDRFCAPLGAACRKGCAACCTDKVMITTLEGLSIAEVLEQEGPADWALRLQLASERQLFRHTHTINQWAAQCLADDAPEEDVVPEPATGVCPFLTAAACPIYAVRPLACRAMLSRTTCSPDGAAEMPEAVLALNTVLMQYVEAIDRPGLSGNLIDILRFLADSRNRQAYISGRIDGLPQGLLPNQPLPALMVPPEQRERLQPVIQAIQAAIHRRAPGN
jgi:Fe-S-cluster containining protein